MILIIIYLINYALNKYNLYGLVQILLNDFCKILQQCFSPLSRMSKTIQVDLITI